MRLVPLALALVVFFLASGCSDPNCAVNAKDVPCSYPVSVEVRDGAGNPVNAFSGTFACAQVRLPSVAVSCPVMPDSVNATCIDGGFRIGHVLGQPVDFVDVTVTTGDAGFAGTLYPVWETSQDYSDRCNPEFCRDGRVVLTVQ